MQYDVIIIGAGASGLMAAMELALTGKTIAVAEARNRTGGRIETIHHPGFEQVVEAGAEFIHGDLELTAMIMEKAKLKKYEVKGEMWQKGGDEFREQKEFIVDYDRLQQKFKALEQDLPVDEFMDKYLQGDNEEELRFTLKNYVEGYYAADTSRSSTFALKTELENSSEQQYRIEGGYSGLVNFLYQSCLEHHVEFHFNSPVNEINWEKGKVEIKAGEKILTAKMVLVTVPVGVLQSGKIDFTPALPQISRAAKNLGFGPVVKTILQFETAFWTNQTFTANNDLSKMSFLFSEAFIPTWWTSYPRNSCMLTGWSGGPHADAIKNLDENQVIEIALESLGEIFDIGIHPLQKLLKQGYVANWPADEYSLGAYSYEVVNGHHYQDIIKQPIENTIYFAGEGLIAGPEIGTVEAALRSGRETAHQMIAHF